MKENDKLYEQRKSSKKKNHGGLYKSKQYESRDYSFGQFLSDVGNQEIQKLFKRGFLRAKLNISQPRDKSEQEADKIAQQVINTNSVDFKTMSTDEILNHFRQVQIKTLSPIDANQRIQTGNESLLQQKSQLLPGISIPSTTESKINNLKGVGNPLSDHLKNYFEPRFGTDFDNVRLHTDSNSNRLAASIKARAFTLGNDIAFGKGEFQPETIEGKKLIAHELVHTLQQSGNLQREEIPRYDDRGFEINRHYLYFEQAIKAMDEWYNTSYKGMQGWKVIINLQRADIIEVLKIIYKYRKGYFNLMKMDINDSTATSYLKIGETSRETAATCIDTVEGNTNSYELLSFRENLVSETIAMLDATVVMANEEIETYSSDDTKLTELAELIKDQYGSQYRECDLLRAKALLEFCRRENVKERSSHFDYFVYNSVFVAAIMGMAMDGYKEEEIAAQLQKLEPDFALDVMASFIFFTKQDIDRSGMTTNYHNTHYNQAARNYVLSNYALMEEAELKDILTTYSLRTEEVDRFRILTDIHTDFRALSAKDIHEIKPKILEILRGRKSDATNTKKQITGNHNLIWELKPLVGMFMQQWDISKESAKGQLILNRVQETDQWKTFRSLALGILGLALGIAGFFTAGTTWGALTVIGGVTISTLDLVQEVNNYTFHSDAATATYEFAMSMDPGVQGIAFALLGLILDAVDVVKAGGKIIREAAERIARASGDEFCTTLIKEYNTLKAAGKIGDDVTLERYLADVGGSIRIDTYNSLRKITKGTGAEVHHLIEKRFLKVEGLNGKAGDMLSTILSPATHRKFTNAWREWFKYGINYNTIKIEKLWEAAQVIYKGYPELIDAAKKTLGL